VYCEPVKQDLDGSPGDGGLVFAPACEGFDCGPHGACVPMNGNPTCQCEGGYGAIPKTTYDTTGNTPPSTQVTCQAVGDSTPNMPVLPPPGQTEIPDPARGSGGKLSGSGGGASGSSSSSNPSNPGNGGMPGSAGAAASSNAASGGGSSGGSGCAVSRRTTDGAAGTLLAGLVAAGFVRLRRRNSARRER
jgi:hypothetical protein